MNLHDISDEEASFLDRTQRGLRRSFPLARMRINTRYSTQPIFPLEYDLHNNGIWMGMNRADCDYYAARAARVERR